ncbi:hypothetical protein F5878DRAFT_509450, partial [Lentinula raphanica]
ETFVCYPYLALVTADGPAMAMLLAGTVGHQGRIHCRFYCRLIGRHKPGAPQYYPARLKPTGYTETGCDHDDVDLNDLLNTFNSHESHSRYMANVEHISKIEPISMQLYMT